MNAALVGILSGFGVRESRSGIAAKLRRQLARGGDGRGRAVPRVAPWILAAALAVTMSHEPVGAATSSEDLRARLQASLEAELPPTVRTIGLWYLDNKIAPSINMDLLREDLELSIIQSGRFQFVNRELLSKALEEMNLCSDMTCLFDPATVQKIGQARGIDALVYGQVIDASERYRELGGTDYYVTVLLKAISTSTSAVIWSREITGMNEANVLGRIGTMPTKESLWREEGLAREVAQFVNSSAKVQGAGIRTVAFLQFDDLTGKMGDMDSFYRALGQAIIEKASLKLVDRENIRRLLEEQKLVIGNIVESSRRGEIGKLYGVDAFIFGRIREVAPEKIVCSIRVSHVESNVDLDATIVTGSSLRPELKLVNLLRNAGPSTFQSLPAGADVSVDGEVIGRTPVQWMAGHGTKEVRFNLQGYAGQVKSVEFRYGQPQKVLADLMTLPCVLTVTSEPSGAKVTLDGAVIGTTPITGQEIQWGTRRLQISKALYVPVCKTVELPTGEWKLDLRLPPKTASKAAVRSVLLPGWGQQYKGQTGKAWLARTVAVAGAAVAYAGVSQRKPAIDDYLSAKAEYDAAVSSDQIDHWYGEMESCYDKVGKAENLRNAGFGVLGGIWLLNIADAALGFPARGGDNLPTLGSFLEVDPAGGARLGVCLGGVVR